MKKTHICLDFQDKDVYLIDDIFSAVDGHVAAHIYRKVVIWQKTILMLIAQIQDFERIYLVQKKDLCRLFLGCLKKRLAFFALIIPGDHL